MGKTTAHEPACGVNLGVRQRTSNAAPDSGHKLPNPARIPSGAIQALLRGDDMTSRKMCHECGEPIQAGALTNICSKCFEYYRREFYSECEECGGMGKTVGFLGNKQISYPCETCQKPQPQPITGEENENENVSRVR